MEKTTQKELRRLVRLGAAIEITNTHDHDATQPKPGRLRKIAYSSGVYGINGALFQDETTGQLYAITSRSTALFYYC